MERFINHLNKKWGTNYKWVKCLDVAEREHPEPEGLLEDVDSLLRYLVVERKTLLCSQNYIKNRQAELQFRNIFLERMSSFPIDGVYMLEVRSDSISLNKHENEKLVDKIADGIFTYKEKLVTGESIGSSVPVFWHFYRLSSWEIEEEIPSPSIGVRFCETQDDYDILQDFYSNGIKKVENKAKQLIVKIDRKFKRFKRDDCLRIALIEYYGYTIIPDTDIDQIFREIELPDTINQLWASDPEFVSAYNWKATYRRIRQA